VASNLYCSINDLCIAGTPPLWSKPGEGIAEMSKTPPSTVLAFDQVCLSYPLSRSVFNKQRISVLENISFTLESGKVVGIIGRNGAGKSSLLKLMAGVLQQDSGRIIRPQQNLRISLLTMQLGFQLQLSGRENATLGCLLMGFARSQAQDLLPEIISFSGLKAHIDDPVGSYSSGMRARLGFSVAYHTKADIMLIDEALGAGDHEFKLKSRDAILDAISSDRTAVLVSHDELFLTEQCDELLWFENGLLVKKGKPTEVLDLYHDYNHVVLQLSHDMGIEVEEVRAHPRSRHPIELISSLTADLRCSRAREKTKAGEGVRYYYPSRRDQLSQLCMQECGSTAWVERSSMIATGEDHAIREQYRKYEDLLYSIGKAAKINRHDLGQSALVGKLLELLLSISQHSRQREL
jgi:lipopolysaccharide transport system ATP-binding protein